MTKKTLSLLSTFLFLVSLVFSQSFTISGYVTEKSSGEKLINAAVFNSIDRKGTISNEYGFYSLTLTTGNIELNYAYVGYATYKSKFYLNNDTVINIALEESNELQTVEINAEENAERFQERTQMSTVEIPIDQIKALPAFLGEVDVLKAMQLLPGVSGGTEGTSGIFVRGGSPDQNLILLDGVPVYNASHLFGFFSVFNSDAINKVTLIKGGFPARYGGRLSSVVDIRMKEGNMNEFHGEGSIGLVASRLTFEGPIKKGKTSFIVSGRRTYIDLITRPIIKAQNGGDGVSGYYFYDLNAKINHKFSDKDRLYISGYFGRDKAYFKYKYQYDEDTYREEDNGLYWGNATAVARWNHLFTKKIFSNLTATFTDYKFDIYSNFTDENSSGDDTFLGFEYFSGIYDWSLKYDLDYIPLPSHYLKFGGGITYHTFQPGATQFESDNEDVFDDEFSLSSDNIFATEFDIYAEDDWEVTNKIKINYGIHASAFLVNEVFYKSLQPRFSARYLINPKFSFKASFSTMTQYIHLLTNSGIGLPTDLWVPATDTVPPQQSYQPAIGIAYELKEDYELSVEGYYKKMKNIIEYKDGANYLFEGLQGWEDKVERGEGWAYGAELFIQKKEGKLTGWVGYTLSWSYRQFPYINLGEKFPYKYDRRHDFEIAAVYKINDKIDVSGTWVYSSGQPISLPIAKYEGVFNEVIYAYEGRNGYRMNAYHRMDINLAVHKEKKLWSQTWNFGAYNLYNHLNPFFIYQTYDYMTNKNYYRQVSLFPIIPSVSYEFKW
ncbi:MAG: TonB-dependent receptor plug domain-containing protein [Chitinophagales bacterium]